ncbi:MAG: hypothetical protein GY774_05250 [Planctomycetes bacterium]|nr:hypothetical protein [Planctomycetota bacterium]
MDRQQKQQVLERHKLEIQQLKKQMGLGKSEKEVPAKSEKELMKQILRATEKQWKAIKPKVDKVRELRSLANVSIKPRYSGGGFGYGYGSMDGSKSSSSGVVNKESGRGFNDSGGDDRGGTVQKRDSAGGSIIRSQTYSFWRWSRPSQNKGFENLNEGEKICEELFRLLEDKNSELEEIRQKMEALQKFRQEAKAKKELAIVQQELRQLVTPHQEAALVMMQILD